MPLVKTISVAALGDTGCMPSEVDPMLTVGSGDQFVVTTPARMIGNRPSATPDSGAFSVERVTGIEPALSAWEADVLPLNYTRRLRTGYLSSVPP
jgi:hypothetical protein